MTKVDLAKLISPLFWISRPLGLLPISHKNGQFVISRAWLGYSGCATCLCFFFGAIHLFQMMWRAASQPLAGENILDLFINSIVYFFSLLNIFYVLRCSSTLRTIFQQLDALLKILAWERDVEKALTQIRIFTALVQVKLTI